MPAIGPRCHELRIVDRTAAWRIVYRTDADAVVRAEVFRKTAATTPAHVIETCNRRLKDYDSVWGARIMDNTKRKKLEGKGWKVRSAKEFLRLTSEEAVYVELKLALSRKLADMRRRHRLTQVQAAKLLQSSQSRVAKMEAGDPSVSLDLLVRSLLALGLTMESLARTIRAAS
jgi:DNA-binding XRE family transcriptional regulator